jgi:hypothetical protein
MFGYCTVEALFMRWLKRDIWKAGITVAGMLLFLVLMVWVPVSAAGAGSVALSVILGASKSSTLVRIGYRSTLIYAHLSICCYDSRKMQQSRKWYPLR